MPVWSAAALRHAAIEWGRGTVFEWLGSSPMAGMLAGWGFGFACQQALVERPGVQRRAHLEQRF